MDRPESQATNISSSSGRFEHRLLPLSPDGKNYADEIHLHIYYQPSPVPPEHPVHYEQEQQQQQSVTRHHYQQQQQQHHQQQHHQQQQQQITHQEQHQQQQAPSFLTHIAEYIEREEGESVHFECCLGGPTNDPDLKIEWLFNGKPLATGSRFHTINDFGFTALDIDWLHSSDSGEYICRASNKHGSDLTRAVLRVKPGQRIVSDSSHLHQQQQRTTTTTTSTNQDNRFRRSEYTDVIQEKMGQDKRHKDRSEAHFLQQLVTKNNRRQFNEGDDVHFEAKVGPENDGNLVIEWFHNDRPLIGSRRFKTSSNFGHVILDIFTVYPEDSGVYKCVARNASGMDASEFEIQVASKTPSLVYHQPPPSKEVSSVQRVTDIETQWNRTPEACLAGTQSPLIGPAYIQQTTSDSHLTMVSQAPSPLHGPLNVKVSITTESPDEISSRSTSAQRDTSTRLQQTTAQPSAPKRSDSLYQQQQHQQHKDLSRQQQQQFRTTTTDTTTTTIIEQTDRNQPSTSSQHQPEQYRLHQSQPQQQAQMYKLPETQQVQQQQQQQQPLQETTTSAGKKLVKRWDWNKAEFVTAEVPDRPAALVPPPLPRSQMHASPTDVWHQQQEQPPLQWAPSASTSKEPQTPKQEPGKIQLDTQYDPAWLSMRHPDIESVQSDPLYRDLMVELQRLEDGVQVKPETPVMEQEPTQRPVFRQAIKPDRIEVNEYENVEFVCRLIPTSDPNMKVEWSKNSQPLQESSRLTNEFDFGVVRLCIRRCEAEDSGVYQCRATNALGRAISTASLRVHAKGNVQCETLNPAGLEQIRQLENPRPVDHVEEQAVEQPPKFLTHIADYVEKDEGESVHFECCLAPVDDPDLKTEWLFNGRPLVTGSRFHTIDDFGFIVLDIDWLFPRDTGEYICRATNKYGTDITRTVLRVKPDKNIVLDSQLDNPEVIDKLRQLEFPDVVQETFVEEPDKPAHFVQHLVSEGNKRQFNEGDNVHFEARVGPATDGTLTVEWFHNDKPLISGHRFKPSFDFGHIILDILYVYPEDSGVYKCITRNATGSDVSKFEIHVTGKPSLVLQSQLPREMVGGVQKINEMEAMWNRAPDPEEEEEPAPRRPPEFVLKPKPCTAFEGSCARFCCRIVGNPKPRPQWMVNNQVVVSGSRYKLTYDGMYHLIIPKCQLSDAGVVKVYARNLLGDCFCTTELKVKRKVDDYRGVLKNSPNPWYDEQALKMYQRQRSQDLTDDEEFLQNFQQLTQRLQLAPEQQSTSPFGTQVIGYMEPGTPDVNLLARTQSPLVGPGDLHPVVTERQVTMMAPAPSTIQRALNVKDSISVAPEKPFQLADADRKKRQVEAAVSRSEAAGGTHSAAHSSQDSSTHMSTSTTTDQRVFGLNSQQQSSSKQQHQSSSSAADGRTSEMDIMSQVSGSRTGSRLEHRLPPPSPENKDYGKERHSHIHKQTQMERRANKEIIREIIEKETFEQEHSGLSKDNVVRGDSVDRGSSPSIMSDVSSLSKYQSKEELRKQQQHQSNQYQQQQQQQYQQQQYQQQQQQYQHQDQFQSRQHYNEEQQVLIEEHMTPPEFLQKIQPCQAIDGDEARFECTFKGDPKPTISWFRENKMIKPSNLYTIVTDLEKDKSTLTIKRVNLNSDAVYTVKAENLAGSAKSSANLVVEPHPLPQTSRLGGHARQVDYNQEFGSQNLDVIGGGATSSSYTTTTTTTTAAGTSSGGGSSSTGSRQMMTRSQQQQQTDDEDTSTSDSQKVVKSVRTRKISSEEMASLIRKSPEGLIAPTFLHVLYETTVSPGDLARLDARLIGSQPMEVRWIKDGQRVRADKSHKMLLEGDLYTLLILECSMKDEGNYECVASNGIGEARCGARLTVADRRASASRTPDQMSAADQYITSSSSSSQYAYATTSTSQQQSAQQQAEQQQKSSWSSAGGQKTHYGLTKHQYNPLLGQYTTALAGGDQHRQPELPRVIKRLENQQVLEGKPLTLRCQISSFPMAEVHWYKQNDKLIKPSKYFRIFKDNDETYCLKILEVFPEDQGEYKCVARASNHQSQVETKATITVIPNSPSTKEQVNRPDGSLEGEKSSTIQEIMRSVRNIQQDMDSKLKNMEEKIQRFLDNLDDDHYDKDGWSEEQVQQQQQQQNAAKSPKEQQQGTMTQ